MEKDLVQQYIEMFVEDMQLFVSTVVIAFIIVVGFAIRYKGKNEKDKEEIKEMINKGKQDTMLVNEKIHFFERFIKEIKDSNKEIKGDIKKILSNLNKKD